MKNINVYDDKNAIDWLINTDAVIAVMPLTQCIKSLKIDSRLSIVFPNAGVPLMWNFLLINNIWALSYTLLIRQMHWPT